MSTKKVQLDTVREVRNIYVHPGSTRGGIDAKDRSKKIAREEAHDAGKIVQSASNAMKEAAEEALFEDEEDNILDLNNI